MQTSIPIPLNYIKIPYYPQQDDFWTSCPLAADWSDWLILIAWGCNCEEEKEIKCRSWEDRNLLCHNLKIWRNDYKFENRPCTSILESDSESLCFISLAIEKKTSSTFRFVFALCSTINVLKLKFEDNSE